MWQSPSVVFFLTSRAHSGLVSKASPFAHAASATLLNPRCRQKGDAATANTNPTRSVGRPQRVVAQPAGAMRAPGSLCAISPHLQQENGPYSICAGQISQAAQFIKANYRYKALEVISTRRSQTYAVRLARGAGGVASEPPRENKGPTVLPSQETGWSDCDTGQSGSGPLIWLQSLADVSPRDNRNLLEISPLAPLPPFLPPSLQ